MKHLLVAFALLVGSFAAPDVGGYAYDPPSSGAGSDPTGSYLPPGGSQSGGGSHGSTGGGISYFPGISYPGSASNINEISGSYLPGIGTAGSSHLGTIGGSGGIVGIGGGAGGGGIFGGIGGSGGHGGLGGSGGHGGFGGLGGHGGFGSLGGFGGIDGSGGFGSAGGVGGFGGIGGLGGAHGDEVFFYGDDNNQPSRLRINIGSSPNNRRVIFVKSPDSGSVVIPEIVAPSGPSQDKTVVYVLSRKQQPVGSITVPSGLLYNTARSKPEVYQIKYTNPEDAAQAVSDTLSGHASATNIKPQSSKDSFVKTLGGSNIGGISGSLIGPGAFGGHGGSLGGGQGGLFGGQGGSLGGQGGSLGGQGGSLGGQGGSGGHGGRGGAGSGGGYGKPGASGPY